MSRDAFHSMYKKIPLLLCSLACYTPIHATTPPSNADRLVSGIMSYTSWDDEPEQINFCIVDGPAKFISTNIFNPPSLLLKPNKVQILHLKIHDIIDSPNILYEHACNVLYFVGTTDALQQKLLSENIAKVLSISENNLECSIGSSFCLFKQNNKYHFKVNLNNLRLSKIRVNSKVLKLSQLGENFE